MNRTESVRLRAEAQSRTRSREKAWHGAHPSDAVISVPAGAWDRRSVRDRVRDAVSGQEVPLLPVPRWKLARELAGDALRPLSAETIHEHLSALASERKKSQQRVISPELPRPAHTEEATMSVREFLEGEVGAGRLDLAAPVTEAEKRRLARTHGCTASRIGQVLAELRKAVEKQGPQPQLPALPRAQCAVCGQFAADCSCVTAPNPEILPDGGHIAGMPRATEAQACEQCGERPAEPDDLWCEECNAAELERAKSAPQRTEAERDLAAARAEALFYRTQCEAAAKRAKEQEATLNKRINDLLETLDSSAAATRAAEAEREKLEALIRSTGHEPHCLAGCVQEMYRDAARYRETAYELADLRKELETVALQRDSHGAAAREAELARLRETLEFYADPEHYPHTRTDSCPIASDCGYRAAQALSGTRTTETKAAGALCERGHLYGADRETCPVCELAEVRGQERQAADELRQINNDLIIRGVPGAASVRERVSWLIENWQAASREERELRDRLQTEPARLVHAAIRTNGEILRLLTAYGIDDPNLTLPERVGVLVRMHGAQRDRADDALREREEAQVEAERLRAALAADADRDLLDLFRRQEGECHEELMKAGVRLPSYPLPDRVRMLTRDLAEADEREKAHVGTIRRLTKERNEAEEAVDALGRLLGQYGAPEAESPTERVRLALEAKRSTIPQDLTIRVITALLGPDPRFSEILAARLIAGTMREAA